MAKLIRLACVVPLVSVLSLGVALAETVDLNSADAETLAATLHGIGEHRAAAIVEYREANGGFDSVDALADVQGVGPMTVENNRERMTVGND